MKNFNGWPTAGDAIASTAIEATLASSQQDVITPLRITVRDLKASFDSLVNEQRALGFNETEGTTADLIRASNEVEKIIHNDLSWIADADAAKLLVSLLTMRRHEIEYRLTRSRDAEQHFLDEVKHFNSLFDSLDGAPAMKQRLSQQVQHYSYTFAQWVASTDNIEPLLSLIDHDTASVLPEADKIIATAQASASDAADALAAARARTRYIVVWVGISSALIGLACSFGIGWSITRPLEGLAGAMKRVAAGDTSARIPATDLATRDRRHGAHGDRVSRQHDRTRTAFRRAGRHDRGARTARRSHRGDDRAIPQLRGTGLGAAARVGGPPRACIERAQRGGRRRHRGSARRRDPRRRRFGQCHHGGKLDRGTGGLDRGNRRAGRRNRPRSRAAPSPNPSARSTRCRNWAAPPTASAR